MAKVSEEHLSPEHVPESATPKTGVKRVNNAPIFLIGGAALVFLIVMALVAAGRAEKQNAPAQQKPQQAGTSSMLATDIVGFRTDGFIEAAQPPVMPEVPEPAPTPAAAPAPEKPAAPALKVVMPNDLDAPPAPDRQRRSGRDDEAERIRTEKMQRFGEALRAKTGVRVDQQGGAGRTSSDSKDEQSPETAMRKLDAQRRALQAMMGNSRTDATAAYKAKLAQLREMGGSGGGGSGGSAAGDSPFMQAANRPGYGEFDKTDGSDRWQLKARPEAPRSAYELRAGFVVPATLISGINSDLPGQIVAQVAQDVYDTPTGRYLLLPQGSRLVGAYSSDIAYGQSRILVAWQRIVFPDGKAMDIGAMPGSDSAGYSGFTDQVNNHLLKLFGSAFLMSGITAGITLSQDNGNSSTGNKVNASSALSEALGQQLGQVTAHIIEKNLNVAPTLDIRPGYRFNVIVTKDLDFDTPYQSFDYKGRN